MSKQEEIRAFFAGEHCSFIEQEFCTSDCPLTRGRKDADFCNGAYQYADDTLHKLDELGVVLKVERELGKPPVGLDDWSQISVEEVVPLIEEKKCAS